MSVDYTTGFVLGWEITERERLAFLETCENKYEDFILRANAYRDFEPDDLCFLGDEFGFFEPGQWLNLEECGTKMVTDFIVNHGVTAHKDEVRIIAANAGLDPKTCTLFQEPRVYLVSFVR